MTEPTSNCDGNESLVAARSDLFDRLPTSALSRIMRFLDYNPIIPINDFSVETKPWKALPQLRQRQWLDTHRGDIWKEFVQAGTPTSQYLLNGPWSYGSILAAILKHLSGDLPAGDALCVELQILERIWRELPRHLPSGLLGQALCELGAYLGITGGIEQVKASIDTQLRNQLRDPRKLIQKPVSLSCAVILSLINQKYLDIARLSASKPVQSLLTIVVDGVRGVVEDPNYVKVIPVVLEILFERVKSATSEQTGNNLGTPMPSVPTPAACKLQSQPECIDKPTEASDPAGDPPSTNASRADLEKAFRLEMLELERALRKLFPHLDHLGRDRRSLGQLIEIGAETKRIECREVEELRQVNRTRNALYHAGEYDVQDTELIRAIRSVEMRRKYLSGKARREL